MPKQKKYYPLYSSMQAEEKGATTVVINGTKLEITAMATPSDLIHCPPDHKLLRGEVREPKSIQFVSGPLRSLNEAHSAFHMARYAKPKAVALT